MTADVSQGAAKVEVSLGARTYDILIGDGLVASAGQHIARVAPKSACFVLTDENVARVHLPALRTSLEVAGIRHTELVLPAGESTKSYANFAAVCDAAIAARMERRDVLVALGGGVIGDLGGYAASAIRRGMPFVQVPTSLLSQVDSSVGGKTGVNHPLGKNMIGAFYQPQCVIADADVLDTLDDRQLSAGLAEVIKYGLIRDVEFFEWLEQHIDALLARDKSALAYAIERSCLNKAEVVAEDETETGVRATLNLGHTFGHAIETGTAYGAYLHGEAVAIGTCQAADLSRRKGWLTDADVERIIALFTIARLPVVPPEQIDADRFLELMAVDKKNVDGKIRLILLTKIGVATLPIDVDQKLLVQTLKSYGRK